MPFCPNCGKEVPPQVAFCRNCGYSLGLGQNAARPTEDVSMLYWLLPFFFALIGGIIAYLVVKDRNRQTANYMLIFGLVWSVVGAIALVITFAFFTGLIGGLTASSTTFTYTALP